MNTVDRINQHREKLIELNKVHNYSTILASEKKQDQYYRLLLELRKQKIVLFSKNRESNPKYVSQVKKSAQNILTQLANPLTINNNHYV